MADAISAGGEILMGFKLVLILTMSNDKALAPRAKIYLGNGREVEKSTLQKYPRCVKNLCSKKKKKEERYLGSQSSDPGVGFF